MRGLGEMDSAIATSLIAAGSATGGILLKMIYDATIERIKSRKEKSTLFLQERKKAYDEFIVSNTAETEYRARLGDLTLIARAGLQVKPEVLANFPTSPMKDLVSALEAIRRLAHTHEIVKIAERIVRLHGDASAAMRLYMVNDELTYGLPLFLVDRFGEDCILEFVAAYRKDLGIGPPKGARKDFPIMDRGLPMSLHEAERFLRIHLGPVSGQRTSLPWPETGTGKPLTAKDSSLLATPKFRALLVDDGDQQPA